MITKFIRWLPMFVYTLVIHVLAFWGALMIVIGVAGKSPNSQFILFPSLFAFYFVAGWVTQRRTDEYQLINATLSATAALLIIPLLIYLNRVDTGVDQPIDWSELWWFLPLIAVSVAGVLFARYKDHKYKLTES